MSPRATPCAACKFLRRKCLQECIFAPHFPPNQPQKFANVHKAFGKSNVEKILKKIPIEHREEAANTMAFEAEALIRDPVHGCVGTIYLLTNMCEQMHSLNGSLRQEISTYTTQQQQLAHQYYQQQMLIVDNQQQYPMNGNQYAAAYSGHQQPLLQSVQEENYHQYQQLQTQDLLQLEELQQYQQYESQIQQPYPASPTFYEVRSITDSSPLSALSQITRNSDSTTSSAFCENGRNTVSAASSATPTFSATGRITDSTAAPISSW